MLNSIQIPLAHTELAALCNVNSIDPKRKTLVLVHGYLDNANSFVPLIAALSQYQCIAIDLAGHGYSRHRSKDAHYHLVDYAYDLSQVISSLGLSKVVLVGHSLGAIVSYIYASTHAEELCKLICIESCGPLAEDPVTTAQQIKTCFESREKANRPSRPAKSKAKAIEARVKISDLSQQHAQLIVSRNLEKMPDASFRWRSDKRLRTMSVVRMTEEQAMDVLLNIKEPWLVILGSKGFEKVKAGIDLRQQAFKKAQILEFKGGHHVHLDACDRVAKAIRDFIES